MLRGDCLAHVRRVNGGFTYLGVLIAVLLMAVAMSAASSLWSIAAQREKEVELVFVGHQFRTAIARYYAADSVGFQYPKELQDLVEDDRSVNPRHFLRKIFPDPITGKNDWEVIRTNDGGIIGVASSSKKKPLKRANFEPEDAAFEDMACYCDWQFLYQPRRFGR